MRKFTRFLCVVASIVVMTFICVDRVQSQTTLLTEGWEATTNNTNVPPAGWVIDNLGYTNITYFRSTGNYPSVAPFEGSRLVDFNSYSYGTGTTNRLRMSAPVSTVGYTSITVDFEWYTDNGYAGYTNEGVTVQWSTDGVNWTSAGTLWMRYAATNQWVLNTQALPAGAANQTTLYVGFLFLSQFGNDCHMDIMHVKGTVPPTTLLGQGWEATTNNTNVPPAGWVIDPLGYTNITYFRSTGNYPSVAPYEGSRLVDFNSYSYGTGTTNRLRMSTPISTVGYANINVDFAWYTDNGYAGYNNEGVTIQWSTDGVNWTSAGSLWMRYAATNQWVINTQALPVGAQNQPTLYVGFLFLSQFGNDCHMDIIHVTGTLTAVPPTSVTQSANNILNTTATLNGTVNANGFNSNIWFDYGLNTGYGTTVAGVPPTATGNSPTSALANITGLTPGTLYHYRIRGVNIAGAGNGNDMTFTTLAMAPPTATTNAATNIHINSAQLNATVNPNLGSTTVTFEWGLTAAYGNTIPGVPGTVTGNTPQAVMATLPGLTISTTYHYRVVAQNAAGTTFGNDQTFTTCVNPAPAGAITGPANVCIASTGNVYAVDLITDAVTYVWSVPPGAIISTGNGTAIISVDFPLSATSGVVSVYGSSICGNGIPATMNVTVNPLPVITISGPASSCVGYSNVTYTTQAGNSDYNWSISGGGEITGGLGTNSISVTWSAPGAQSVSVNYTSPMGCTQPNPVSYPVTVNASPAPTITGQDAMCINSGYYYYSTEGGFSNYQWAISPGGTITFGQGTNQIQVMWNNPGSQWITVNYSNPSGCYAPSPTNFSVYVSDYPGAAGTVSGPTEFCVPATGQVYSVNPISGADTYVWSLPAGATITAGDGTNMITVDFAANASSGIINVYGNSLCGNGTTSPPLSVTANPTPAAPVITVDLDYILHSDIADGNQWYKDGIAIPGATGQTHDAHLTGDGTYWDIVTVNGCSSVESNHIDIVIIGTGDLQKSDLVKVYPNPTNGIFRLEISTLQAETFDITIVNNMGSTILKINDLQVNGTIQKVIDLSAFSDGVYNLIMTSGKNSITKKIVLNK